jgi:hypothetical protein
MNGLRRATTILAAAAMLAISAVVAFPAFADDGSSGSGKSGDQVQPTDNSGDHSGDHSGDQGNTGDDHSNGGDHQNGDENKGKDGSGKGEDKLDKPDKPDQGDDVNAELEHGVVLVRLPGSHRVLPLKAGASIPVGAVVDARHGKVKIESAPDSAGHPQHANFTGAVFQVVQGHTGEVVTTLVMRGRMLGLCKQQARRQSVFGRSFAPLAAMSARRHRAVRRLWGSGHGHFRTRGRHGAATVRGTVWLTADYCDGTLVKVKRGLVGVRDFTRHKTVEVPAGHSYFAKAK